ncbi:Nonaspanin [Trema orientale]|uniref:Transmembrane 9 superfamily member n=1 Tax=Trema orientale TaxID=63057 RepID=A0A2P5EDY6_TREOI|nr:Nonaspanin [Trema orientale]
MYYDDLPMWSFLGKIDNQGSASMDDYKYLLYTHIRFQILFNKDRIIDISARIRTSESVDLTEDKETYVEFVYTVYWKKVDFLFEERMAKYLVTSSLTHFAVYRLFSIIISSVTVVLSTVFLVKFYIHVLKKDFTLRGLHDEKLDCNKEERGWKCIQDEVFTHPVHKSLLAAALGSGTQLLTM